MIKIQLHQYITKVNGTIPSNNKFVGIIKLPNSLSYVGLKLFDRCDKLESIDFGNLILDLSDFDFLNIFGIVPNLK